LASCSLGNSFTTAELHPRAVNALGASADRYTLASLRYDLSKLRAKGLVEKARALTPLSAPPKRQLDLSSS
jgi:hypothetical protein